MVQRPLVLASGSTVRRQLLEKARVPIDVHPARIDEMAIQQSFAAEEAHPRDLADALAEAKARKVAGKFPEQFVLGCDQVLALGRRIVTKAATLEAARSLLIDMRSQTHHLYSAAVIYNGATPEWRHVGVVRLKVRPFSDAFLDDYLGRNWPDISEAVGCYKLEGEGVRLFSSIQGDYFDVLGLPLIPLLAYLTGRGVIME